MRVLLVTTELPPLRGGVADHVARLAGALRARGVSVETLVAAPRPPGDGADGTEFLGALDGPAAVCAFARRALAARADVVSIHAVPHGFAPYGLAWNLPLLVLSLARARHVSLTVHEVGIDPWERPVLAPLALAERALVAFAASAATSCVVNTGRSSPVARIARAGRVLVIPNPASFEPREGERWSAREHPSRIGTFGLLGPRTHLPALVRAFARVAPRRPGLRLVLLGAIDHPRAVEDTCALARDLGVSERLEIPGDLPAELCSRALLDLDAFVLARPDGDLTRSSAFMTAAAHGLPCVAVRGRRTGFGLDRAVARARSSSPEDLGDALERVLADHGLRAALGGRLGELYRNELSWPKAVERYLALWAV